MKDTHVRVTGQVDGRRYVSLSTDFGWVEKASIVIDAVDIQEAQKLISKWLDTFNVVPFQNDVGNECYIDPSKGVLSRMKDSVAETMSLCPGMSRRINHSDCLAVGVKFEYYYEVDFGEESEA